MTSDGFRDLTGQAAACAVVFVLGLACAPEASTPPESLGRDSAGTRIVENPGEDRALPWEFERRLTLGTVADGPQAFHRIDAQSVAFDSAGRVYVLDKGNKRVVVFERTGAFVRQFGRAGDGPDEFRFPRSIWISPTGEVEILDTAHGAVQRFAPGGAYVDSRPVDVVRLGMSGRVEATLQGLVFDAEEGLRSGVDTVDTFVYYVTGSDTLQLAHWRKRGTRPVRFRGCRVRYWFEPFFSPEIEWDATGGRIVISARLGYVVDVFVGDSLALSVRRPIAPLRVSDADVRRVAEPWVRFRFGGASTTCTKDRDELIRERRYETERQAIADVAVGPDGTLWVRRTRRGQERGPTDVFDASGRYLGTLSPSSPFPIAFAPSGEIVTKELDELDVEHLVFYRVRRGR